MGYPIVLDVAARLIVVVGGGRVGLRKVKGLLESGATKIRVVAPHIDLAMPGGAEQVQEAYRSEHVAGASLVFAATDVPEVNATVVRDAHHIGALVCRADLDEDFAGDFATPALLRDGPLLVTISTGGSPAFSAMVRDRVAQMLDPRWKQMAAALQNLRPMIRKSLSPDRRRLAFRELCSDDAMTKLSVQGTDGLKAWLKEKFPELRDD